jgi:hypothetical protein
MKANELSSVSVDKNGDLWLVLKCKKSTGMITEKAVPFSEELWQKGWQPVTRDGRLVRDFVKDKLSRNHLYYNFPFRGHLDQLHRWTVEGKAYLKKESDDDLFLIAPTN